MSSHLQVLHKSIGADAIRATAEAMGLAVVLTDDQLVTGRAGLFSRWGNKIERFELDALAVIRTVPNPSANLLQLEFTGSPPQTLVLMYPAEAVSDFTRITGLLQARLELKRKGGGNGK
jgi:hypothetical protein